MAIINNIPTVFSDKKSGLVPKSDGDPDKVLYGDGNWKPIKQTAVVAPYSFTMDTSAVRSGDDVSLVCKTPNDVVMNNDFQIYVNDQFSVELTGDDIRFYELNVTGASLGEDGLYSVVNVVTVTLNAKPSYTVAIDSVSGKGLTTDDIVLSVTDESGKNVKSNTQHFLPGDKINIAISGEYVRFYDFTINGAVTTEKSYTIGESNITVGIKYKSVGTFNIVSNPQSGDTVTMSVKDSDGNTIKTNDRFLFNETFTVELSGASVNYYTYTVIGASGDGPYVINAENVKVTLAYKTVCALSIDTSKKNSLDSNIALTVTHGGVNRSSGYRFLKNDEFTVSITGTNTRYYSYSVTGATLKSGTNNTYIVNGSGDVTITLNYLAVGSLTIITSALKSGDKATLAVKDASNNTITSGYRFTSGEKYTVTLTGDHVRYYFFNNNGTKGTSGSQYTASGDVTVTLVNQEVGTLSLSTAGKDKTTDNVTVSATLSDGTAISAGYRFITGEKYKPILSGSDSRYYNLTVGGSTVTSGNEYTASGNVSIGISKKTLYTLSIDQSKGGTITVKYNGTSVSAGYRLLKDDQISITINDATTYKFTVTGATLVSGSTYKVTGNVSIVTDVNVKYTSATSFSSNSWQEIADVCKAIREGKLSIDKISWQVGDVKEIQTTFAKFDIVIIGKEHDTYSGTSKKAPFTFQFKNMWQSKADDYYQMNTSNTNSGGWKNSYMRGTVMPKVLASLPNEVKNNIQNVNKATGTGGGSSSGTETTQDGLFLLSEVEVFGSTTYSVASEGSRYKYYDTSTNRKKYCNAYNGATGSANYWWERSPHSGDSNGFCFVYSNGDANNNGAPANYYVSPAFCL